MDKDFVQYHKILEQENNLIESLTINSPDDYRSITSSFNLDQDQKNVKFLKKKKIPGITELFTNTQMMKFAVIAGMIYFFSNYNYYGSVFGLESLQASIYFNSMFSAFADLIGNLMIQPVVKRYKRKSTFFTVMTICMLLSFGFLFIHTSSG